MLLKQFSPSSCACLSVYPLLQVAANIKIGRISVNMPEEIKCQRTLYALSNVNWLAIFVVVGGFTDLIVASAFISALDLIDFSSVTDGCRNDGSSQIGKETGLLV